MRTLTRRLNKTPKGSNLNLRVTARIGAVRAREIIALKKVRMECDVTVGGDAAAQAKIA